jgi:hypothetical protein
MRLHECYYGHELGEFLHDKDLSPTSFFRKRGNGKIKIENGKDDLGGQVLVGSKKSLFGKIKYTITDDTNDLSDKHSPKILVSCLAETDQFFRSQSSSNKQRFIFPESCTVLDTGNWDLEIRTREFKVLGFVVMLPLTLWQRTKTPGKSWENGKLHFYYLTENRLFSFVLDTHGNSFQSENSYFIGEELLKGLSYSDISLILSNSESLNAYLDASQAKQFYQSQLKAQTESARQQKLANKALRGTKRL